MAVRKPTASRRISALRATESEPYILDDQIGFILRQVIQRHSTIFAELIGDDLTPTQWATLAKLAETGPTSQNQLGRLTAMDAATIQGVVVRLMKRDLVHTMPDPTDARLLIVQLTERGERLVRKATPRATAITQLTLAPLTANEQASLISILRKLH